MRRVDDTPFDPEIAAQLDAIDATLAGDPVDPEHAELAELALLLAATRPVAEQDFARSLDERVAARFRAGAGSAESAPATSARSRRGWSWLGPLAGIGTAAVAAVVAVVVIGSGGTGASQSSTTQTLSALSRGHAPSPSASVSRGGPASASRGAPASASQGAAAGAASSAAKPPQPAVSSSSGALAFSAPSSARSATPQPVPNGRKLIQSAQLQLSAAQNKIDAVSQELFDVVGRESGYVRNSSVTAGSGGFAQFQLSVPSSALQATMTALSQLHFASVVARTDATQDVNGEFLHDQRKLADDRALRTGLLKQLANATTQEEIDSLKARIADAESSIRSDESTLNGLTHRIDFSDVTVTINSAIAPPPSHRGSGGFTLGKAAHDAGRVLTVAAGVALITLAALVPVALIAALGWWIGSTVRRRRREQALDLA